MFAFWGFKSKTNRKKRAIVIWSALNPKDIQTIYYNTIQYNGIFRAPIAKNKSYSKALYIVQ